MPSVSTRLRPRSSFSTRCGQPAIAIARVPSDGDALMDELADGFTYEHAALDAAEVARAAGSLTVDAYAAMVLDAARRSREPASKPDVGTGTG